MTHTVKKYMLTLMKDERDGFFDVIIKGFLRLFSWVYAAGIKAVDLAWRMKIRREHKVGIPVVSVGNITLGGTGKTPLVMFLADHLVKEGKRPAILTRGYGRDESIMLKDELAEVPVFVGQDRVRNARLAASKGAGIVILDDGFQHRRIARGVNILLLEAKNPFGNGFLFPRGVLREPVSSIKRADLIVLTKTDKIALKEREEVLSLIKKISPASPVVLTRHKAVFLKDVSGLIHPADELSGKKVSLFSGIADADYFASLVEGLGAFVSAKDDFTDHHRYSQKDIDHILQQASQAEMIITTSKDYVKVKNFDLSAVEERLYILYIAIDIIQGKEFLDAGLDRIMASKSV